MSESRANERYAPFSHHLPNTAMAPSRPEPPQWLIVLLSLSVFSAPTPLPASRLTQDCCTWAFSDKTVVLESRFAWES